MSFVYNTSSLSASPLPSICSCMSSECDMNATHSVTSPYLCNLCENTMHQSTLPTCFILHLQIDLVFLFICIFQSLCLDSEEFCLHKSSCNISYSFTSIFSTTWHQPMSLPRLRDSPSCQSSKQVSWSLRGAAVG